MGRLMRSLKNAFDLSEDILNCVRDSVGGVECALDYNVLIKFTIFGFNNQFNFNLLNINFELV